MSRRPTAPGWFSGDVNPQKWSQEENKLFENALALHDNDAPDRWMKVAAMIPGKSIRDVMQHYRELEEDISDIEAGLIPIPGYTSSAFTLDWADDDAQFGSDDHAEFYTPGAGAKRSSSSARSLDQDRKKGVPWTEDEHRLFLLGLKKYGKGDWRNISHYFVITRTPTQVASHAQKFFLRQSAGPKDKRRSSIHDITTVSSSEDKDPSTSSSASLSPEMQLPVMQPDVFAMANGPFGDMFSSGLRLEDVGGSPCEGYGAMFQMQSRKKKY